MYPPDGDDVTVTQLSNADSLRAFRIPTSHEEPLSATDRFTSKYVHPNCEWADSSKTSGISLSAFRWDAKSPICPKNADSRSKNADLAVTFKQTVCLARNCHHDEIHMRWMITLVTFMKIDVPVHRVYEWTRIVEV